jgi:hypothetical protein
MTTLNELIDDERPNVRASGRCPICARQKQSGLLVCWPCWRSHDMKFGNPRVEALIAKREAELRRDGPTPARPSARAVGAKRCAT